MSGDMFAFKTLRCDCGYEVREADEAASVDAVRRHASQAHGIDFSAELALDLVRQARLGTSSEQTERRAMEGDKR
jgi:predicted small metal-binding protein